MGGGRALCIQVRVLRKGLTNGDGHLHASEPKGSVAQPLRKACGQLDATLTKAEGAVKPPLYTWPCSKGCYSGAHTPLTSPCLAQSILKDASAGPGGQMGSQCNTGCHSQCPCCSLCHCPRSCGHGSTVQHKPRQWCTGQGFMLAAAKPPCRISF